MKITETTFNPQTALAMEGLLTQGSGYLHVRGSLEEHLADAPQNRRYLRMPANVTAEKFVALPAKWGTYVPGIFGNHPLLNREMINLPWFLGLAPIIGGERLDMQRSALTDYRRELDLLTGTLTRTLTWRGVQVRFERFISAAQPHLCVQRLTLTGTGGCVIEAGLEGDVVTSGHDHLTAVNITSPHPGQLHCEATTDSGDTVRVVSELSGGHWEFAGSPRRGLLRGTFQLPVVIEKRTTVTTSRDLNKPAPATGLTCEQLHAEHCAVWAARWAASDVIIEGDEQAQLAMRTSLYHLLRCHVPNDPRVTIDAKGYAGDAYFGRFFWDTEMYLLPFFLYTDPGKARTLVDFRVQALPGARDNAQSYGYRGARYPWESDDKGHEGCPSWQYRDHEIHVTADVAYGFAHFAAAADAGYLKGAAAEALVEMGRYWLDRVDWRAGQPHLLGVMGPNEYTPLSSNNAYTNRLVAFALTLAAEHATGDERRQFLAVAQGLPIPRAGDLVLQCDGFDKLADPEFDKHWKNRQTGYANNVPQERLYRSQALKQADVLMLMMLFPREFTDAEVRRAWDYYLPLTTHDSSLSSGAHAIVACRLGLHDAAWKFWQAAAALDLDLDHGGAAQGIHIANAGANWLVAVFGFAGLESALWSKDLQLRPQLPAQWTRLAFPLVWRGCPCFVDIRRDGTTVTNRGPQPLVVNQRLIAPGKTETL